MYLTEIDIWSSAAPGVTAMKAVKRNHYANNSGPFQAPKYNTTAP